jgi:two-component system sensor histidine kinase CpxA
MKLFLKIFLWFLTAVALMFVVIIFVTRTFQTEPMFNRWQRSAKRQMTSYGGTVKQIFDSEGEAGLQQYIARQRESEATKEIGLIDENGRVSAGELANANDLRPLIDRIRESGAAEIDASPDDAALGAVPVNFANGEQKFLVVKWPPPRAPSLFFDSWLGFLRLIGLLLTAIVVCYLLALYLTAPIRKLRQATQRFAGGDLQTRVASPVGHRRDEIGDLARDFDVMAERIESLITSQQRLTRDVSHELRSPLARMNVALEIAKQKSNAETAPLLERIENESSRLNDMISRLLTLARLESGAEDVERVRLDLTELVRDIAADADFEAQAKGKFVEVAAADNCTVVGSEVLLRSAIENVLRNAVRYTPERTVVEVSVAKANGHAIVKVADHGGGVPPDELENLFRPFYRVGEARERKTGGIGLGLAIAERAVRAHKGTITAKNVNDGLLIEIQLDSAKK